MAPSSVGLSDRTGVIAAQLTFPARLDAARCYSPAVLPALLYAGAAQLQTNTTLLTHHAVDAQRSTHHLTTPGAAVTAVVDPVASVFKPELNGCIRGRRGLQLLLLVLLPTPCISCHPIAWGRLLFLHIDAQTRTAVTPLTTFGRGRSLLAFAVVFAPARRLVCQRMLRACSARSALHMCV